MKNVLVESINITVCFLIYYLLKRRFFIILFCFDCWCNRTIIFYEGLYIFFHIISSISWHLYKKDCIIAIFWAFWWYLMPRYLIDWCVSQLCRKRMYDIHWSLWEGQLKGKHLNKQCGMFCCFGDILLFLLQTVLPHEFLYFHYAIKTD